MLSPNMSEDREICSSSSVVKDRKGSVKNKKKYLVHDLILGYCRKNFHVKK